MINYGELNKSVKLFCKRLAKDVQKEFKRKRKNPPKWDYPAMASVCCWSNRPETFYEGVTTYVNHNSYPNRLLRNKLLRLGQIGRMNKAVCEYPIGHCAEPHAAQKLLKNEKGCNNLGDIYFSVAMRPRTCEKFAPCYNCRKTFPTLDL